MDSEVRKRLADDVLASLTTKPPVAVRALASALELAGGPLARFSQAFDCYADCLEFEDVGGALARLRMARDLGRLAFEPEACADLLDRLEGVQAPPWPQLRAAVAAIANGKRGTTARGSGWRRPTPAG